MFNVSMLSAMLPAVEGMFPNASRAFGVAVPILAATGKALELVQELQAVIASVNATGNDISDEQLAVIHARVDDLSARVETLLKAKASGIGVAALLTPAGRAA